MRIAGPPKFTRKKPDGLLRALANGKTLNSSWTPTALLRTVSFTPLSRSRFQRALFFIKCSSSFLFGTLAPFRLRLSGRHPMLRTRLGDRLHEPLEARPCVRQQFRVFLRIGFSHVH